MYSLIEQRKDMNEDDVCEWERAHETIDNSKWHGVRAHCSGVRLRHLFWLASFVNQIDTVFAALCTTLIQRGQMLVSLQQTQS